MGRAIAIESILNGIRDNSGEPLSGGLLYSYEPGTTTDKDLYTDQSKTTAAANPYTLDANGQAQLYADGSYKFVIKDSGGSTIETWDNLLFGQNDVEPIWGSDSTGSSSAYAVSTTRVYTSYFDGMEISFVANHTNTSAATLAVDGLTAKSIKDAAGNALRKNEIRSGDLVKVVYDGTDFIAFSIKASIDYSGSATVTPAGSMTFTSSSIVHFWYKIDSGVVTFSFDISGTIGGTPSSSFTISNPVASMLTGQIGTASYTDGGTSGPTVGNLAIGSNFVFRNGSSTNFTAGAATLRGSGQFFIG